MAPDLRMVSDPAEVWRRTNSSGKRFQVPEFDAICRGPRVDASRESSDVMGLCALSAVVVWAGYERCHVGSTRMLLERFAARAMRGPVGSIHLIF